MSRVDLFVIDKARRSQAGHHFKEASLCDPEALCTSVCKSTGDESFSFMGLWWSSERDSVWPVLGIRTLSSLDSTVNRGQPKGS